MADADYELLDERFADCVRPTANVERLYDGCRWAEGPAWFPAGRYLVWSDIPNDRMLRWDEISGGVDVFRSPSDYSNGNTVDRQGRLVTLRARRAARHAHRARRHDHRHRRRYDGHRLNSPNDVVVARGRRRLVHRPFVRDRQRLRGL